MEHRLTEEERTCTVCGATMEEIGKEVRRSLQMEPAHFWIREAVYYTYACKQREQATGEGNLLKTTKQPVFYPGSFCLPGGGGPDHGAEICDARAIPPGSDLDLYRYLL